MYLFPTKEDLDILWREISPKERCLRAMRQAVNHACMPSGDSMAAFFLEGDDVSCREEDGEMIYHINPPSYLETPRDICPVRFTGWDFAVPIEPKVGLGEKVKWDEI